MSRIYRMTEEAERNGWDWDEILYRGAIETVEGFEDYQEAVIILKRTATTQIITVLSKLTAEV